MTKHKEKEEEIIERKDMEKDIKEEAVDLESVSTNEEQAAKNDDIAAAQEPVVEKSLEEAYLDGWKRCQADFENYKKRQDERAVDFTKYASLDLILQILPVVDNFHAATDHIPEEQKNDPWVMGIMYIQKQLETVLTDKGVSEIEVKVGDKFNPEKHEAIEDKQDDKKAKEKKEVKNKVAKVILKGYQMSEKVIRPARVVVE